MTSITFHVPTGTVHNVRSAVSRLSGVLSGQVTSCILDGPPLAARMVAVVPEDRLVRVLEVATDIGAEVELP